MSVDGPAVPAWRAAFDDYPGNVDYWFDTRWNPPGHLLLDVGVTPTGCPRSEGISLMDINNLTPETDTSTHYFWGSSRNYKIDQVNITRMWEQALIMAFAQDKDMLEAQQCAIGNADIMSLKPVSTIADRANIQARRIVARLIEAEQSASHAAS
jgi:vanillate O-demethylase monooxygenase subunit